MYQTTKINMVYIETDCKIHRPNLGRIALGEFGPRSQADCQIREEAVSTKRYSRYGLGDCPNRLTHLRPWCRMDRIYRREKLNISSSARFFMSLAMQLRRNKHDGK